MSILDKLKNMVTVDDEYENIEDTMTELNLDERPVKPVDELAGKKAGIILIEPTDFAVVATIVDYLKADRIVTINLHKLTPDLARRVVDFVTGAVYAIEGTIEKAGPNIFICAPKNIGVKGEISSDDIEHIPGSSQF